jgi:hypothetical protein
MRMNVTAVLRFRSDTGSKLDPSQYYRKQDLIMIHHPHNAHRRLVSGVCIQDIREAFPFATVITRVALMDYHNRHHRHQGHSRATSQTFARRRGWSISECLGLFGRTR